MHNFTLLHQAFRETIAATVAASAWPKFQFGDGVLVSTCERCIPEDIRGRLALIVSGGDIYGNYTCLFINAAGEKDVLDGIPSNHLTAAAPQRIN